MKIEQLAADLIAADFTVDALERLWGAEASAALFRGQRLPAVRALRARRDGDNDALSTLATLFVLGLPASAVELATALPSAGIEGAAALGLVELSASGGQVRPLLDLRPYEFTDARGTARWWVASDLGELALGHAIGPEHVLGIGGASNTLTGLMIDRQVDSVLDLGTGCGIQALHASRHARRVVATDISKRAIELATFNARLNGITNIEFRLGDLFEPVVGERFDHIVSNPPFVITPRDAGISAYEYRDGGMVGDAIVHAVISGAAVHLNVGGVAQFLGNWESRRGAPGLERVAGWLDNLDASGEFDAWVVEREVQDAASYAETWIRDDGTRAGTAEFDTMYEAWLTDFATRGVESVGFGYVMLHRTERTAAAGGKSGWRRLERVQTSGTDAAGLGQHIAACLDAAEWLRVDDAALIESTLVVAGDVTEERHYWPGAEGPSMIALHQGGGFGRTTQVDSGLAAVVGACDGDLTLSAICGAVAQLLDVDDSALRRELLPQVKELVATGFLLPGSEAMPA